MAEDLRRALRTLDELALAGQMELMTALDAKSALWRALISIEEAQHSFRSGNRGLVRSA